MRDRPLFRSLSARLLALTVAFVMVTEILILVPSVARDRLTYLQGKLADAHLAALALEAAPNGMVTRDLETRLLDHVGAYAIDVSQPDMRVYMLSREMPPRVAGTYDLRRDGPVMLIVDAVEVLLRRQARAIRVVGPSPKDPRALVDVVIEEQPLRAALIDYSGRILGLSVLISLITAALVFLSLDILVARPVRRIIGSMMAFRDAPEAEASIIVPSRRSDEIGMAQRELASMQTALRAAFRQRERLAALGTAVNKVNHDLRNMLASAALVSERLAASEDPDVRRLAPRLLGALDRAANLCDETLAYARDGALPLKLAPVDFAGLVDAVAADLAPPAAGRWDNRIAPATVAMADRDQLARVLANLARNAFEAGAGTVTVSAAREAGRLLVRVADDGPGLAPRAREHLFEPFTGSARPGGTGLGLAIAREIMRSHGGDIRLAESAGTGTTFVLDLPAAGMSS